VTSTECGNTNQKNSPFGGRTENIMKGMRVTVYRPAGYPDCTNHGLSSMYDKLLLTGEAVPQQTEEDGIHFVTIMDNGFMKIATPLDYEERVYMFGGNFVYSNDSSFPFNHPIPVFDRYESDLEQKMYTE